MSRARTEAQADVASKWVASPSASISKRREVTRARVSGRGADEIRASSCYPPPQKFWVCKVVNVARYSSERPRWTIWSSGELRRTARACPASSQIAAAEARFITRGQPSIRPLVGNAQAGRPSPRGSGLWACGGLPERWELMAVLRPITALSARTCHFPPPGRDDGRRPRRTEGGGDEIGRAHV